LSRGTGLPNLGAPTHSRLERAAAAFEVVGLLALPQRLTLT